ncbi:uncharacterized protein LOC141859701 isoform X1 [Acropora palmata]|uniref:uncharacterized protein LOC141859701 isoform X1 n=1 Tax=Acropora palmata TaxID=6131 RepID=UPI003D9FE5C0
MKLAFSKLMAWVNITSFLPKSIPIHQKFWLDLQEKSFKRLPLRFFALSFIQEIGHWPSFFCNQCMVCSSISLFRFPKFSALALCTNAAKTTHFFQLVKIS